MTRTLTPAAQAQSGSTAATPINIVKVEFGGGVGTTFYSDRALGDGDGSTALNAQDRVRSWGRISAVLAEQTASAVGDCTLELSDADGVLKGYFDAVEFQRKRVTLYQHFAGLGESDMALLMAGVINAPVRWGRTEGVLRFDVTDISTFHRATVGHLADCDTFPFVSERDENTVLPIVFGRVRRSEAAHVKAGPVAILVRGCTGSDTYLYVNDASRFPQNQAIQIRIENELIEGHFEGNTFHVTQRGVDLIPSSTTTRTADIHHIEDDSLTGEENEYAPHFIRVTDPGGTTHHRPIWYYSADLHRIGYTYAIIYDGSYWTVPEGTDYAITTWARDHAAGALVYYVQDSYVYLLNDAPSKAVYRLEGYGRILDEDVFADGQKNVMDIEGYTPIDPNLYTVNLNDTTGFPALGRAVTTATFKCNPKEYYPRLRDNRLWADLDGVEDEGDGTGDLVENPAQVIRVLLERWLGLGVDDLDADSFDAAADALTGFRMAFTLARQADALHLCADLAFQARCALLWEGDTATLAVLRNRAGTAALSVGAGQLVENALQIGRRDIRDLASEVVARYGSGQEIATVVLRDDGVEAAFGRRVRALDLWAYAHRRMAVSIAQFWLSRWKYLFEEVRLSTFLTSLQLQRNDTVELDLADHFLPSQKGTVQEILHLPGSGEAETMDTVTLGLRLPIVAGCATTCETECESSGESGCLLACEIEAESGCWQCETQCEALCELACTTEAELHCIVSDTGGGGGGGCGDCETSCETGCELSCETGCQVACESGCELSCETGCELSCESGCEVACETGCELSCESGCEVACELACEVACQTGCETSCELACEATSCETACEIACQTGCETSCELACEATACETGCEISCQTGCETSCELACEATACETGCEVSCQVGCETSCELACEATACETGCQVSCQTGCEVGCETGCEAACQTGCETSCETGACETSCETGCETGEEGCTSYSDDFDRASLGADWTTVYETGSTDWTIVGNAAVMDIVSGGWQVSNCWYSQSYCSDNHEVKGSLITAGASANWGEGIIGRGDGNLTCYIGVSAGQADTSYRCQITKQVSGARTNLGYVDSSYDGTYCLQVNGSALKLYKYSGTWSEKLSVTNSDIPSGKRAGIWGAGNSGGDPTVDGWQVAGIGEIVT